MRQMKAILRVLLILALIIVFGCGKKKEVAPKSLIESKTEEIAKQEVQPEPEVVEPQKVVKQEEVKPLKPVSTGAKVYKVQVLSLTDRYAVELQKEMMAKKGVKTEISEFNKDGVIYYRLRLEGKYSRQEADELGARLKNDFWGITDCWIVKVP